MTRATERYRPSIGALALAAILTLAGCQSTGSGGGTVASVPDIADLPTGMQVTPEDLFIVDCLLPGTARRLGTKLTYVTARRAIKAPAYDCARRGGEYSLPGQSSRQAAIAVWRGAAEAGDPEAQTYLGEVLERGLGGAPDPVAAARWYEKAAAQGHARAQVNLAALYEAGTGVSANRRRAAKLYAAASGLSPEVFDQAQADPAAAAPDPAGAAENARLRRELAEARGALDAARGRIAELTDSRARAQGRLDRLEGERAELRARLADLDAGASAGDGALAAELAAKEAEIAAARTRAEDLTEALRAAQARAERKLAEAEAAAGDSDRTDRRVAELTRQLAASRRKLEARETALSDLAARERTANAEIARLGAEQRRLSAALEARAAAPDSAGKAEEVARLRAEVAALDATLAERSDRIAALQGEIETVRSESTEELDEARATAEALLAEREDRAAALAGRLAEVQAERDRLRGALDSQRSESAEQRDRIASLDGERAALAARLAEASGAGTEAERAEIARLERRIAERETALAESRAKAEALQRRLDEIRQAATGTRRSAGSEPGATGPAVDADVRRFLAETRILFGDYHALVIGNSQFAHLPDLRTPGRDAEAVASVLRERYGFKVRVLRDATRYEILTTLNEYYRTLTENDNFLLYYAGHGELDDVNDRGHWLPVDAEPDNRANWLSSQAITDQLNGMNVRKAIVIADSCYSGILTRAGITSIRPGMSRRALKQFLIAMADKKSRMVLSSGGVRPVLDGGGSGHSVFARAFLDALAENEKVLEGFTLYRDVAQRVTVAAAELAVEQTPEYAPMRFAGHESGDFFFIPDTVRLN